MTFLARSAVTVAGLGVLLVLSAYMSASGLFGFGVPPYYSRVLMLAGINIVLAV